MQKRNLVKLGLLSALAATSCQKIAGKCGQKWDETAYCISGQPELICRNEKWMKYSPHIDNPYGEKSCIKENGLSTFEYQRGGGEGYIGVDKASVFA